MSDCSSIVRAIHLNESRKKVALNSLVDELSKRLSSVKGYSHHRLSIEPNMEDGCVDIIFKGTDDMFRVYPQRTKLSNLVPDPKITMSDKLLFELTFA